MHGFAHQAGGTIKVASELGKGTTFTILLPRETAITPAEAFEVAPVRGSGTVLLVEDNPDVAMVSIGLLEQLGYRVRQVADAESALREVETNGVDLVFSDIVMPGNMDGLGLAIACARSAPTCRSCSPAATAKPPPACAISRSCASRTRSTSSAKRSRSCRGDGD